MINKLLLILLAALSLAFAGTGLALQKAQKQAKEASQQAQEYQRSLSTAEARLARFKQGTEIRERERVNHRTVTRAKEVRIKEEEHEAGVALAASPEWADQPIPDGLRKALGRD